MSFELGQENLTDRPVTEFVPHEDTIYVTKMKGGHQITYLCRFVSYERGVVTGEVIEFSPKWAHHPVDVEEGITVRARLAKCYLWGNRGDHEGTNWPHCNWFDAKTKKA